MSGIFVVDPRGMTAKEWTAASTINLERFGAIPALHNDDDWQDWGAVLSGFASLSGINVPNPFSFTNWQEWAERFNEVLAGRS